MSEHSGICIEVSYRDQQTGHYPVPRGEGWKIDASLRLLIIGRGVPRKVIPLDNVHMIEVVGRPTAQDPTAPTWNDLRGGVRDVTLSPTAPAHSQPETGAGAGEGVGGRG